MIRKIILASNNNHKIREIQDMLKDLPIVVKSLKEEGIEVDIEEDGKTFEENSKKKATEIAEILKNKGCSDYIVMADDSGLEVDFLDGAPGVYSARYAGEHGNDILNNEKLLGELKGVPAERRGANFVCQLALMDSRGNYISIRGEVKGRILESLSGKDGFGYDPLFYYEPLGKSFGELTAEEKNKVSHRSVALNKFRDKIKEIL